MFRLALVAIGGYAGYRLAKLGESRYNFIIATVTAAIVYKLTRDRMTMVGEVAENGTKYVEAEVVKEA